MSPDRFSVKATSGRRCARKGRYVCCSPIESTQGAARPRPVRELKTDRTASVVIRGHAFIHSLRRGYYAPRVDTALVFRLATAVEELQLAI